MLGFKMKIHIIYGAIILTIVGLSVFALDTQEMRISELEADLNATNTAFLKQSSQIAKGLCLPILEMK